MAIPSTRWFAAIVAALSLHAGISRADAQYFGRNKVQYRTFDFHVLETEHFKIYFYPEEAEAAERVARMAERWRARLTKVLEYDLQGAQPIVLYASQPHFQQTNVIESMIGEGTGGVTESLRRRIVMPMAQGFGDTDHVLGHELVHAFQYAILKANASLPLWFVEGMAEYLSLGSDHTQTSVWLRDAAELEELPSLDTLDDPRYFPYRFGHAFWAYVGQRFGDQAIAQILASLAPPAGSQRGGGSDPIAAIEGVLGVDRKTLSQEWQQSIIRTMLQPLADRPLVGGRPLITASEEGEINVGPVLSPDGRRLALLTSRDRLSIGLVIADARTGRIERTIVEGTVDPHFESLQFIDSAGTWDPAGQRLAIAAFRKGRPVVAIYDVSSGDRIRELALGDLDEAVQPAWSPDGRTIVVSGLRGGIPDLYALAVESGELRQLTRDIFVEQHPAWAPDGRRLVFATDRFSSEIESLRFGPLRLAILDVTSGAVSPVAAFDGASHVSPQWTTRGIYFIADPDGIPDVYVIEPVTGRTQRLTRSSTGVIGITPSAPALSVARDAQHLSFVHYRDGGYEIRTLEGEALQTGEAPPAVTRTAARLAPATDTPTTVDRLLASDAIGLPVEPLPEPTEYDADLGLDFAGQSLGVATGGIGPYVGGGIAFRFSDMLGNHVLETVAQINGEFEDLGGLVGYINRTRRWNWGGYLQQIPYVTGFYASGVGDIDGQPVFVEQAVRDRQVDRQILGVAAYPLSRNDRFEFGVGLRHLSFEREIRTRTFDPFTGGLIDDTETSRDLADPVTLGQATVAYVRDTSFFGATGPILGHRSRFELSPSVGDLDFTTAIADIRQYVMPFRPLTVAGRFLHVGRYGGSAEAEILTPLYLGFPNLVRGYDINSFTIEDCGPSAADGCENFDRLIGSRIAVANLELRAPLVGAFTGKLDYGAVPVDLIAFFDAGVAWTRDTDPSFFGSDGREWARSVGVGLRANAFGYAVLEFDAVKPLDRIRNGWRFVFAITPGF
jgi:Tol biopolymer transport system component